MGRPAAGMAPEFEVSFTDPTDRPRVRPRSVAHTPRTLVPRTGPPKRSSPRVRDYFHEQEPRKIRRERRFGEPTFSGASALAVLRDRRLLVLARRVPPLETAPSGSTPHCRPSQRTASPRRARGRLRLRFCGVRSSLGGPGGQSVVTAGASQDVCQADSEHGAHHGSDDVDPKV